MSSETIRSRKVQELGFFSLLALAQALGEEFVTEPVALQVLTTGLHAIDGGDVVDPDKALVIGPIRVIPKELPNVSCISIDIELGPQHHGRRSRRRGGHGTAGASAATLADLVLAEFAAPGDGLVAYRNVAATNRLRRLGLHHKPVALAAPADSDVLAPGRCFVLVGGLGGVGSVFTDYLARELRARLVILQRSHVPPRAEWESIIDGGDEVRLARRLRHVIELEAYGAEVMLIEADVCDRFALDAAFEQATAAFGQVDAIINFAALMDDGLIQEKLPADTEAVLGPKVVGTKNLYALAEQYGVGSLVLFSSTSAIIGAAGQIDYAAANAFQDAFASSPRTEFGPRVVSINWGVWNNLGLSARAIGDILIKSSGAVPLDPDVYSPFFDAAQRREHSVEMSCSALPGDHWLFSEHRTTTNVPTMPGTGYLDLAISSRRALGFNGGVELRDVTFLQPLQVTLPEADSRLSFDFTSTDDGFDFAVQAAAGDEAAAPTVHVEGQMLALVESERAGIDLAGIRARCTGRHLPCRREAYESAQAGMMRFGPRWDLIREQHDGDGEALAQLVLADQFLGDLEQHDFHAAIADIATGFAMDLIEGYSGSDSLWVPLAYGRLRWFAPLESTVFSWVRCHRSSGRDAGMATFDVTIADASGRVLAEIDDFRIVELQAGSSFIGASTRAPRPSVRSSGTLTASERSLRRSIELGIRSDEGPELLRRILGSELHNVVVSPVELRLLIDGASETPRVDNDDADSLRSTRSRQ